MELEQLVANIDARGLITSAGVDASGMYTNTHARTTTTGGRVTRAAHPRTSGVSFNVSRLPVPNLWYAWSGLEVLLLSWYSRHMSFCRFFVFSECTA